MPTKRKTASELIAELERDPEFRAREAQRERDRLETVRVLHEAQLPLLKALSEVGIEVKSVWDLVNTTREYPDGLPILLEHLQRPYPAAVREGIARALAVPEAKFGWDLLRTLYRQEQEPRVKDGLAVAIAGAAANDVIGDVIELARDTKHGESRVLLLRAVARSRDPEAQVALMELATDPELQKEIHIILHRRNRANR